MASSTTVSVAMCTYNGASYIEKQLKTLLSQTRRPDEIVICDDGSKDETIEILQTYESEENIIEIIQNDKTIGITKNFEKAIRNCSCDLIALSDQDDVWKQHKLEAQIKEFEERDIGLCFHNSMIVSEEQEVTTLWDMSPYELPAESPGDYFSMLVSSNFIQGASIMFDSKYKELLLPIPSVWDHDHYIGVMLSMYSKIFGIDENLLKYRKHDEQSYGINTNILSRITSGYKIGQEDYEKNLKKWIEIIRMMDDYEIGLQISKVVALRNLLYRAEYEGKRATIYGTQSRIQAIQYIFENLVNGGYRTYGEGPRGILSLIKDMGYNVTYP